MQVAVSYLVMLAYIACALGYLPRGARPAVLLVTSRASLGLGGVAIVAAAVAGALGLTSAAGLSASLISLEARPAQGNESNLASVFDRLNLYLDHAPAHMLRALVTISVQCLIVCVSAFGLSLMPPSAGQCRQAGGLAYVVDAHFLCVIATWGMKFQRGSEVCAAVQNQSPCCFTIMYDMLPKEMHCGGLGYLGLFNM